MCVPRYANLRVNMSGIRLFCPWYVVDVPWVVLPSAYTCRALVWGHEALTNAVYVPRCATLDEYSPSIGMCGPWPMLAEY